MRTCSDGYTSGRAAYGYAYRGPIRHANPQSYCYADQHPCTDGVGYTYAGANLDAGAHRHANTDGHINLCTHADTDTHPNANIHSRTEPNTGPRTRHRLLPCQRDRS